MELIIMIHACAVVCVFAAIMCENCETYNPCISVCPKKTCDNRLVYDTLTTGCSQESCVEGCDVEPCPPGTCHLSSRAYIITHTHTFLSCTLTLSGKHWNYYYFFK